MYYENYFKSDSMEEITLFGSQGNPDAYISPDNDFTIYLWSGKPVAYLDQVNVYGFNGKHLGWFEDGIIWDHDGQRVGFIRSTVPVFPKFEPLKPFKQFIPFRNFQQFAPYMPFKNLSAISKTPLVIFLNTGAK